MRAALCLALVLVLAVSGCTSTGNSLLAGVRELPPASAGDGSLARPDPAEDACETVECGARDTVCPDSVVVECQEQCRDGLCAPCEPSCAKHQSAPAPADLCASVHCAPSKKLCADGSTATCVNACDAATGICSSCEPACAGAVPPAPASAPASSAAPAQPSAPPGQPTSALSLAVSTDKASITRGSTVTVTALASRAGTAASGVAVHFAMTYASGSQQASDATTDSAGSAVWKKIIGTNSVPGAFSVTASAEGTSAQATFEVTKAT